MANYQKFLTSKYHLHEKSVHTPLDIFSFWRINIQKHGILKPQLRADKKVASTRKKVYKQKPCQVFCFSKIGE